MSQVILGFIFVILAGFLQGTFGLFIKPTKSFKWENVWIIYSLVGVFALPVILAFILTPNFTAVLQSLSPSIVLLPLIFGALWGIGSILFGLSLTRIGVSLTYTIILGLTTLIGTLFPIFINKTAPQGQSLLLLAIGLLGILTGILISGYSGFLRDRGKAESSNGILLGLAFAIIAGLFSPMLNVGFVNGKNIAQTAQRFGVNELASTFVIWMVVLFAGFLVNIFYALFLLRKNDSLALFRKMTKKQFLFSFLGGAFWFGSLAFFGIATLSIGALGASVGWGMFIALSIVISNLWAIKFGEWKTSRQAFQYQLLSIGIIVLGVGFIAASVFSNH